MLQFILFVAYKTVESFSDQSNKIGRFERAKGLIAVAAVLNLVEILLFINLLFIGREFRLTMLVYFVGMMSVLIASYFVNIIFKKSILAKALSKYKDSHFNDYGKAIGLLYIFINLFIAVLLAIDMSNT